MPMMHDLRAGCGLELWCQGGGVEAFDCNQKLHALGFRRIYGDLYWMDAEG